MKSKNFYQKNTAGFSLIEIMVAVLIIGMMLGVAVPMIMQHIEKGEISRVKQDFANIKAALHSYEIDNYDMPSTEQGIEALVSQTTIDPIPRKWPRRGYLEHPPKDPWKKPYYYIYEGDTMELYTLGRDGKEGGEGRDKDFHYHQLFE